MEIDPFNFSTNLYNAASNDFQQHSNFMYSSVNDDYNQIGVQTAANPTNTNNLLPDGQDAHSQKISDYSSEIPCNLEINVQSRIKFLEEELANTQADKEFVWSLWRQLQSTNPDVTSCIASVTKREKDKAELKDRKVLEILQIKDNKINELYEAFQIKEREIGEFNEKLKKSELGLQSKIEELKYMEANSKTFADKEQMYEQMLRSRDDKFESALKDHEQDKQHLISKLRDLVKEAAECQEREASLKRENAKQNHMVDMLNSEIKQSNVNYEKLMSEMNNFRKQVDNNLKLENEKLHNEHRVTCDKNETLRRELNELWSKFNANADYTNQQESIIKQLKQSQNDLQQTIRVQREAFEQENASYKQMYEQMSKKYEESLKQEKRIANEKSQIHQEIEQQCQAQAHKLQLCEKSNLEKIKTLEYEIEQLKARNQMQGKQINDKKLVCDELTKKIEDLEVERENKQQNSTAPKFKPRSSILRTSGSTSTSSSENFQKVNSAKTRSKSSSRISFEEEDNHRPVSDLKRSKSFDRISGFNSANPYFKNSCDFEGSKFPVRDSYYHGDHRDIDTNKMRQFYDNLCRAKDKQLESIRIAHQRRLERLLSLEKQYKLLKDHLRSYVDEEGIKEEYYKTQYRPTCSALNDTVTCMKSRCGDTNIGYLRNDAELIRNDLKQARHENRRLIHENLDMKETIDLLNVKCDEQNERIHNLTLEINYKLNQREQSNTRAEKHYEIEIRKTNERLKSTTDECYTLKKRLAELDSKCSKLTTERSKYAELTAKLTEENKKLYKKWFQVRTNESKFRSTLIEQMNKHSTGRNKRKVFGKGIGGEKVGGSSEFLLNLVSSSLESPTSLSDGTISSSNEEIIDEWKEQIDSDHSFKKPKNQGLRAVKAQLKKFKDAKKDQTLHLVLKQFEKMNKQKLDLESKLVNSKTESEKLTKDLNNLELKFRHLKSQSDCNTSELTKLRKKEQDFKEKEVTWTKQDDQMREDIRKPLESKIKQLSADLSRQIGLAKSLKSESEKLSDKLTVQAEKLNHTERDNAQKKQLIEFYKKKLEEYGVREKNELMSQNADQVALDSINELKLQIKKLNESAEKARVEIKSLKNRIQVVQTEKAATEAKLVTQEKQTNDLSNRLDSLKKDKQNKESQLKQAKQKATDLEAYVERLEATAENKIQTLSDATHQTLTIAQFRLKFAFKSVDNYEKMFKFLYESMITRCIELRGEIKQEKSIHAKNEKAQLEGDQAIDHNMRMAMDLASNVLNLTSNELEDILSSSSVIVNETDPRKISPVKKSKDSTSDEADASYKKHCKKLLTEFELRLNCSKKEKQIKNLNDLTKEFDAIDNEEINKDICDLISQRLNEVLEYERQLASINALKQN